MGYFADAQEAYDYLGGVFRKAAEHPEVGPKLAAAGIDLRLEMSDPDGQLLVRYRDPMEVLEGDAADAVEPDVVLEAPADLAHRYWLGDYNLAVGLARGQVKAKGPVNKVLRLVPLGKPIFPIYREMIEEKERGGP